MAVTSSTLTDFESLSYRSPNLSAHTAAARLVISPGVATTLNIKDSGALCVFDLAAGFVFTLPAPVKGAFFDFIVATTITSNSAKVLTDSAATFLLGAINTVNSGATTAQAFAANGSTHRSINGNGTTTGGIIGDSYRVTAVNSTQWAVTGSVVNTGTALTPFATS
ncbi:MAG: hypothetical protein WCP82_08475 [Alphaproteobacteria bacterium]